MRKQNGFTLIEIAIVLVIVGLLLGGVLKGQELITAARVRNLATTLDGVKVAYLGFQDRFRVLPGDYANAQAAANIPGIGGDATKGCTAATCQDGKITNTLESEPILAWHQLSRAGFITGSYSDAAGTYIAALAPSPLNSPANPFAGYLQLIHDNVYSGTAVVAFNTKTGGNVPAAILAELDRKIDDGHPGTGSFRNAQTWNGATDTCVEGTVLAPTAYNAKDDVKTCGGAQLH
ncbi:MAG: prepilin-type N-terminal cleavage/methylation domain-containing protein [Burkholderiales bacterium]|nr:prepilin-type N-terminal cleavage/methylation domain-containing protein [Burkholderiales bacterium]